MTAPPRLVRKPGRCAGSGSGAEDLLDDALSIADDLSEAAGELDGLLLGPDLDQRETGDGLPCLGERSVGDGDLAARGREADRGRVQAAGGQQDAGLAHFFDELA